jgi:hypothetical protein
VAPGSAIKPCKVLAAVSLTVRLPAWSLESLYDNASQRCGHGGRFGDVLPRVCDEKRDDEAGKDVLERLRDM